MNIYHSGKTNETNAESVWFKDKWISNIILHIMSLQFVPSWLGK